MVPAMDEESESPQLIEPLNDFVGYRLRRVSAAAMAELARDLAAEDFSAALATVLLMIDSNPGETQARIGRGLAIKRANIAPMIGRLEAGRLIKKQTIDGRSFGLVTTARGRALAIRLKQIMLAHEKRFFGSLSEAQRAQLCLLLEKLEERET
jgi:DNA-binding MarR family transcriptional regulator